MSYDLAIWDGPRPASDHDAGERHGQLYEKYIENEYQTEVSERLKELIGHLTEQWPEEGVDDDSPWAAGPLINEASGPYMYLALAWKAADSVSGFIAQVAGVLDLVCFDPQTGTLR